MPRYHFDLDGIPVSDPEGRMLPDETSAKHYAEYVAETLSAAHFGDLVVQVSDEDGRELFQVPLDESEGGVGEVD